MQSWRWGRSLAAWLRVLHGLAWVGIFTFYAKNMEKLTKKANIMACFISSCTGVTSQGHSWSCSDLDPCRLTFTSSLLLPAPSLLSSCPLYLSRIFMPLIWWKKAWRRTSAICWGSIQTWSLSWDSSSSMASISEWQPPLSSTWCPRPLPTARITFAGVLSSWLVDLLLWSAHTSAAGYVTSSPCWECACLDFLSMW